MPGGRQSGSELLFRSRRIVFQEGIRAGAVRVRDGRIAALEFHNAPPGDAEVIEVGEAMLFPGLVDTHVHINEPGRTEWEGFECATRAAAAGGVTTLLDMPLNSIPATTSASALDIKRTAAQGNCYVDVGFIGGVVPGNGADLMLLNDAGVLAWKCFLVDSGVPEFAAIDESGLRRSLPAIRTSGCPLMVHAEWPDVLARAQRRGPIHRYEEYCATRPDDAEVEAIRRLIRLAEEFKTPVHIVHLSSAQSLPLIEQARSRGARITAETCPHYLTFAGNEVPDGATEYKCAPPIRGPETREALWNALRGGAVESIASDHSPAPAAMKHRDTGDFAAAWGGMASLQLGLAAVWTGARQRALPAHRVACLMATNPAELVRLRDRGRIAPGCQADLVVFDPDAEWTVNGETLFHRHPLTPYHGRRLVGRVIRTYLRGELVFADGQVLGAPRGRLLPAPR
jgi:allantoinase